MVQGIGKFVRYREKFETEDFEIEKGYAVFLGEISRDRTFVRDIEMFEIEGSRDRDRQLYFP